MRAVMISALCLVPSVVAAQGFLDDPGWYGSVSEKRGQLVATTRIDATRRGDRWHAQVECEVTDPRTGRYAVHKGSGTLRRGGTRFVEGEIRPLGRLVLDTKDLSIVIGPMCAVGILSVTSPD
jgi:hypothetical protein